MSDAKHLFLESLHDHSGLLEIELADYLNNAVVARYKVTFLKYPAYRSIQEKYRLELWQRRAELNARMQRVGHSPCQIRRGFWNSQSSRSLNS
jgi:hypothetical protein